MNIPTFGYASIHNTSSGIRGQIADKLGGNISQMWRNIKEKGLGLAAAAVKGSKALSTHRGNQDNQGGNVDIPV
ncbi:MAG: hypothetical protein HQ596_02640 [Candidatus Saganbacteria bacterium]|nr:hypothetical protein [Candidatus Saganbacteria bacterium]